MTDTMSKRQRSYCMSRIRSRDTKPELLLKKALRGMRLRYQPKISGRPDFASKKHKLAIFVDGCFWHGCKKCSFKPKSNSAYWRKKFENNVRRDRKITRFLRSKGWSVIRLREHEIRRKVAMTTFKMSRALV